MVNPRTKPHHIEIEKTDASQTTITHEIKGPAGVGAEGGFASPELDRRSTLGHSRMGSPSFGRMWCCDKSIAGNRFSCYLPWNQKNTVRTPWNFGLEVNVGDRCRSRGVVPKGIPSSR